MKLDFVSGAKPAITVGADTFETVNGLKIHGVWEALAEAEQRQARAWLDSPLGRIAALSRALWREMSDCDSIPLRAMAPVAKAVMDLVVAEVTKADA